jgi:hypothetical protein
MFDKFLTNFFNLLGKTKPMCVILNQSCCHLDLQSRTFSREEMFINENGQTFKKMWVIKTLIDVIIESSDPTIFCSEKHNPGHNVKLGEMKQGLKNNEITKNKHCTRYVEKFEPMRVRVWLWHCPVPVFLALISHFVVDTKPKERNTLAVCVKCGLVLD